jgi:hypothetical protein
VALVNAVCACTAFSPQESFELLATDSVLERCRRARELAEKRLRHAPKSPQGPSELN